MTKGMVSPLNKVFLRSFAHKIAKTTPITYISHITKPCHCAAKNAAGAGNHDYYEWNVKDAEIKKDIFKKRNTGGRSKARIRGVEI